MNEDFHDFLDALLDEGVKFLMAGAHALAVHGIPRATGDLDIWIERSPENADRLWRALERFGAPVETLGVTRDDLTTPARVIQIGVRPRRIDILTDLTGVEFADGWRDRAEVVLEGLDIPVIGRATLVENKRATDRLRDRADLESLGELEP
ncbi:MAG: hypothetical protein R3195_10205 [Gemmatimonadota bacterium]|nr:hypothetical protein [Gemmatimonadota bacterium]